MTLTDFLTDEVKQELKEAQRDSHFAWVGDVGFFTWFEIRKNGKLYIYINNLWVQPEHRKKTSLFWIRKYLKNKYPEADYGYWEREKDKDREWHYSKKEQKCINQNG